MHLAALKLLRTATLVFALAAVAPNLHAATPVNLTLNFTRSGETVPVQFRAWLPDGLDRVKGMVFYLPGSAGDTRNITTNGTWQARLPGLGFGIIGMKDTLDNADVTYWGSTPAEARSSLQLAMNTLASTFSRPEIGNAPIIADGLSKGAYSSSYIASLVPDRTLCVMADKCIPPGYPGAQPEQLHMPCLTIGGSLDPTLPPWFSWNGFREARDLGANVALAVDWNVVHAATNPNLPFSFIAEALRVRYPKNEVPSVTPGQPLPLVDNYSTPWLGQSNPLDDPFSISAHFLPINPPLIAPADEYPLDPSTASWLPTKAAALIYRAQNDNTFSTRPLQLSIANAINGAVNNGQSIDIAITLSGGLTSNHIELYHDDDLIGVLTQSSGTQHFLFAPTTDGLQTFIAVAQYTMTGGATALTSNFTVTGVTGVPEPVTAGWIGLMAVSSMRRVTRPSLRRRR